MNYAALARRAQVVSALRHKPATSAASGGLRIGEPNDAYEQEADRMSEEVVTGGSSRHQWFLSGVSVSPALRRKCSCGSGESGSGCAECKKKEEANTLQRKPSGPTLARVAPPIVHEVLNSPGRPLDHATRDFFEPQFGHDLSRVRIHTDAQAAQSAQSVNAAAYSVGGDMVFADKKFVPSTTEGRRLIAHELTHVLQQGAGDRRAGVRYGIPESQENQKAEPAGVARQPVIPRQLGHIGLQRQPQGQGSGSALDPEDQKIVDTAQREAANFKCNVGPVIWGILRKHFAGDVRKVAGTGCETALPGLRTEFSPTDPKDPKLKRSVPMIYAGKAFLAGTDAARLKDRIADVAQEIEAIDAWRLSSFLIDAQDLSNPKITGQLRSMSNTQLVDYKNKTKDSEVKTYTERLLTYSTPTQPGATVDPFSNDMSMTIGNVNVVIKPDVRGAAVTGGDTLATFRVSPPRIPDYTTRNGRVVDFPDVTLAVTVEIVTSYQAGVSPEAPSGYGRGTTAEDIRNKATSLRFHEGSHGEDYIDFVRKNPYPVFTGKNGMTPTEFENAKRAYNTAVSDWGKAFNKVKLQGECVGKTIDEFHKGEKGYKNICP